jgi:hypothetical protein
LLNIVIVTLTPEQSVFFTQKTCQGCQMVYFHTQNPDLGRFWRALEWNMLLYFITIWNILRPFVIIYGRLVYIVFCHLVYFSSFGIFEPRKIWQPRLGSHVGRKFEDSQGLEIDNPNSRRKLRFHSEPSKTLRTTTAAFRI